jgi:hypothetical protein
MGGTTKQETAEMLPSIELTVDGNQRKFVFSTHENFLWGFLSIQSKSMPKEM